MAVITVNKFSGVSPMTPPRYLSNEAAQTALNCPVWKGSLQPIKGALELTPSPLTKSGNIKSIYRYDQTQTNELNHWFHWTTDVDVVQGFIAGDTTERTYFTGDGNPKVTDTTLALTDDADRWNDTAPTTSVFTVDTDNQVNGDGDTYVAYSFHSVEGHSKIGTYTGNGAADGVFVYLGFRPKFLMCKKTSGTESWWVVVTARKSFNPHVNGIELNATADELAVAKDLDLLANGFKSRKATGYHNDSATYMYMAFAETPFKYANSI